MSLTPEEECRNTGIDHAAHTEVCGSRYSMNVAPARTYECTECGKLGAECASCIHQVATLGLRPATTCAECSFVDEMKGYD